MATKDKLREAILELMIGKALGISDQDGTTQPSNKNNDAIGETYDPLGLNTYNNVASLPKHIVDKEHLENYSLSGMRQTVSPGIDTKTLLPKITINTLPQQNYPLNNQTEEGGVDNVPLDTIQAKKIFPTDYLHNEELQSLVNSICVSVANSVAEAITKIIVAKIENNFTDLEIKFDPTAAWNFTQLQAAGPIIPGGQGQLNQLSGQLTFNGDYTHKAKIKFSDL